MPNEVLASGVLPHNTFWPNQPENPEKEWQLWLGERFF
jgi:hypothetical protein